jgi:hypothetical protein
MSRPSTSDAMKVKDMVKIEPAMEEEEDEEKLDHRKRKRNRTIRSCVPCHNHKRKVSHLFYFTLVAGADDSVIENDLVDDVRL